ncbi:hypothetical protein BH23CHL8_BH23CHL8_13570 [soil metagenome]
MAHPNEELLRRVFDTFRRGDRDAVAAMFAEDAAFSYPGPGALHGEYRGRAEIIRFWAAQDRHSGGEFQPQLLDLVAGGRNVFLMVRIACADGTGAWIRVVVYEIADGLIAAARVFEDDPAAAEAFFSLGAGHA